MKTTIDLWHKVWPDPGAFVRASAQDLERFADLVRADEREAIISRLLEIGALEDGAFIEAIRARGNT
jgi:hypothetical protein